MKWTEEHFTGLDWDHRTKEKGVFQIVGGDHKGWSKWVDKELGNYDYLLGIDVSAEISLCLYSLLTGID